MNFETSKYLGGIGALLMFIGVIPIISVYGIVELVGAILVIVAMKGFADYYREAGIFNNSLYAIIMAIVGVVAFVAIIFVALIDFLTSIGITIGAGTAADWASQFSAINWAALDMNTVLKFAGFIVLDFVVLFVFMVVTAIFLRKALKLLSAKSGVGLFGTTGTVLLVGAVLVIAFGLGLILVWISLLLLAIAFFELKPPMPQAAAPAPPPPPQPASI